MQETWRGDGSTAWRVVYAWFNNSTYQGDSGPASVMGSLSTGLEITLPPGFSAGSSPGLSVFPGVRAVGCGDHPRTMVSGDAPQDTPPAVVRDLAGLKFTVAGHAVALAGARRVNRLGEDTLEFSTSPLSCYASTGDTDVSFAVAMPKKGAGSALLSGTRIPAQNSNGYEAADKVTLSAGKTARGGFDLTANLVYLHGDYPISLTGKASVLDCRR